MTTRARRLGVLAAAVGVLAAVVPGTASATPVITMSGSTSVAPLATLLAKEYLKTTRMTTEDIAEMLGFSEAANFRHAFKRWTGKSPSDFRR